MTTEQRAIEHAELAILKHGTTETPQLIYREVVPSRREERNHDCFLCGARDQPLHLIHPVVPMHFMNRYGGTIYDIGVCEDLDACELRAAFS